MTKFSSPLGDFFLYTIDYCLKNDYIHTVLVPLRGFLFIYTEFSKKQLIDALFSSPLGDFFLYTKNIYFMCVDHHSSRPP